MFKGAVWEVLKCCLHVTIRTYAAGLRVFNFVLQDVAAMCKVFDRMRAPQLAHFNKIPLKNTFIPIFVK